MRIDYRTGQLKYTHENNSYDFVMVKMEREAKRSVRIGGFNRYRNTRKGAKVKKDSVGSQGKNPYDLDRVLSFVDEG